PLRGGGQPVEQCWLTARVKAEPGGQPRAQPGDLDPVPGDAVRLFGEGEPDRVPAKGVRETAGEHVCDWPSLTARVVAHEEDLQARSPVMVGGPLGVEPGD